MTAAAGRSTTDPTICLTEYQQQAAPRLFYYLQI